MKKMVICLIICVVFTSPGAFALTGLYDTQENAYQLIADSYDTYSEDVEMQLLGKNDVDWYVYTNNSRLPVDITFKLVPPQSKDYVIDYIYVPYWDDVDSDTGTLNDGGEGEVEILEERLYAGGTIYFAVKNASAEGYGSFFPYKVSFSYVFP